VWLESDNFGIYAAKIENHAGDVKVCAAVSALSYTLVGMLNHCGVHYNKCIIESGLVDIDIKPFVEEAGRNMTDTIFKTIYFGLKQLENTCPDKISVAQNTPIF